MELSQIILVGCLVAAGVFMQGAVGFGAGLFSMPLMILCGVDAPVAISVLLAAVTVQTAYGSFVYRRHIPWRPTLWLTFWRYVTLPLGVYTLTILVAAGQVLVKQIVGGVLLTVVVVQLAARVKPREKVHPAWAPLAGAISGFMGGALAMGGPPVVLWTMAHDWPARSLRAMLWTMFLLLMPPQLTMLAYAFGPNVLPAIGIGFAMAPLMAISAAAGTWVGGHLNRHRLRAIAMAFLVWIAVAAMVGPLL